MREFGTRLNGELVNINLLISIQSFGNKGKLSKSNSVHTISSRWCLFIQVYARSVIHMSVSHQPNNTKRLGCKLERKPFAVNTINLFLCLEIVSGAHMLNLI